MLQYQRALESILNDGRAMEYKNGIRRSVSNISFSFDLRLRMPIVSIKETKWRTAFTEMLWFLSGSSDTKDLVAMGAPNIWKKWMGDDGTIGKMYGAAFRHAPSGDVHISATDTSHAPDRPYCNEQEVDQLWYVIQKIKNRPGSSRIRMTSYIPEFIPDEELSHAENVARGKGALTPCHGMLIQFMISGPYLDMTMVQSSGDMLIGVPYNMAQYAFLLSIIANETGHIPRYFDHNIIDAHIYENQIEMLRDHKLLERSPGPHKPQLVIANDWNMWDWSIDGIGLNYYHHQAAIPFPVS